MLYRFRSGTGGWPPFTFLVKVGIHAACTRKPHERFSTVDARKSQCHAQLKGVRSGLALPTFTKSVKVGDPANKNAGLARSWEFGSGNHSMVPQQSGSTELQRRESACLAGAVAELVPSAEADSISPSPSRHCRAGLSHAAASRLS